MDGVFATAHLFGKSRGTFSALAHSVPAQVLGALVAATRVPSDKVAEKSSFRGCHAAPTAGRAASARSIERAASNRAGAGTHSKFDVLFL